MEITNFSFILGEEKGVVFCLLGIVILLLLVYC